jgi:hypothetical protein
MSSRRDETGSVERREIGFEGCTVGLILGGILVPIPFSRKLAGSQFGSERQMPVEHCDTQVQSLVATNAQRGSHASEFVRQWPRG